MCAFISPVLNSLFYSTKRLNDLLIMGYATKDYSFLNEIEEDAKKQGIKMPENMNKLINRKDKSRTNQTKKRREGNQGEDQDQD